MNIDAINPNELSGISLEPTGNTVAEGMATSAMQTAGAGAVLTGPAVVVTTAARKAATDALSEALGNPTVTKEAALLSMMDSYFETAQNTAENMKMSEQEMKQLERLMEDLKKQIQDLESKKVTLEEAIRRFENTFLAADKALLEQQMMEMKV